MNPKRIVSLGLAFVPAAVLTLWPVQAAAQHRGYHGGTRVAVGVGIGFGHPVYAAPYFYNPYWWGFYGGFYGGFWGHPYFAAPYPYYGYPGYAYYDPSADLRLQVTPRTAEVYVDGYLVGTVDDFDGVFQRVHMPDHRGVVHAQHVRRPAHSPEPRDLIGRPDLVPRVHRHRAVRPPSQPARRITRPPAICAAANTSCDRNHE